MDAGGSFDFSQVRCDFQKAIRTFPLTFGRRCFGGPWLLAASEGLMGIAENKEVVLSFYDAAARGDMERCFALLADDVTWTNIGTTRFSGTYAGKKVLLEGRHFHDDRAFDRRSRCGGRADHGCR